MSASKFIIYYFDKRLLYLKKIDTLCRYMALKEGGV